MHRQRRKSWKRFFTASLVCAVVLAFYVGSYVALVQPTVQGFIIYSDLHHYPAPVDLDPSYRLDVPGIECFYAPAVFIDRRIRSDRWRILANFSTTSIKG